MPYSSLSKEAGWGPIACIVSLSISLSHVKLVGLHFKNNYGLKCFFECHASPYVCDVKCLTQMF